jgi:hypothetical protein
MRAFFHRNRWVLLAGCFLFFGARWLFLHGKPERLRDMPLPGGAPLFIRGEQGYYLASETSLPPPKYKILQRIYNTTSLLGVVGSKSYTLRALPIYGGPEQIIAEDLRPNLIFHRIQITNDTLLYLAYSEKEIRPLTWEKWGNLASGKKYKTTESLFFSRASLHALPLAGGVPVDILPGRQFTIAANTEEAVCLTRDSVYWIEIDPGQKPVASCASLKVMARNGGEPQTLMRGLSPYANLKVEANGAETVWMFVPDGTDRFSARKIYRVSAADNRSQLFADNQTSSFSRNFFPATLQDRVYWKRTVALPELPPIYQEEIHSAKADGSDQRRDDSAVVSTNAFLREAASFYAHKGALYTLRYVQEKPRPNQSNRALLRVEPGSPGRIYEVFRFPRGAGAPLFEGDYVYYTVDEERENIWDWSQEGLAPVLTRTLCRYRLPD